MYVVYGMNENYHQNYVIYFPFSYLAFYFIVARQETHCCAIEE